MLRLLKVIMMMRDTKAMKNNKIFIFQESEIGTELKWVMKILPDNSIMKMTVSAGKLSCRVNHTHDGFCGLDLQMV